MNCALTGFRLLESSSVRAAFSLEASSQISRLLVTGNFASAHGSRPHTVDEHQSAAKRKQWNFIGLNAYPKSPREGSVEIKCPIFHLADIYNCDEAQLSEQTRVDMSRKGEISMRRILQIEVFVGFGLLLGCKPKAMPELENGAKLQQDCITLMGQFASGDIPANLWPRSIKELKPLRVTREENKVRILLRREQGKFTVGYDVFADRTQSPSTQGVWVEKTKVKGVYIFKMAY